MCKVIAHCYTRCPHTKSETELCEKAQETGKKCKNPHMLLPNDWDWHGSVRWFKQRCQACHVAKRERQMARRRERAARQAAQERLGTATEERGRGLLEASTVVMEQGSGQINRRSAEMQTMGASVEGSTQDDFPVDKGKRRADELNLDLATRRFVNAADLENANEEAIEDTTTESEDERPVHKKARKLSSASRHDLKTPWSGSER